jgi:hypothetical protein
MTSIFLPILLFVGALLATFFTYRNIRRGGARFYTLEREIVLRRALVMLFAAAALYTAALGLLYFQRQQLVETLQPPEAGEGTPEGLSGPQVTTPTTLFEQFPPTAEPTSATPEVEQTATPTVCRAVVEGTSGNGLTMRDAPNGEGLIVLEEGTLLTVLEDAPVQEADLVWRKVRAVGGDEGWVAEQFLTIRAPCGNE